VTGFPALPPHWQAHLRRIYPSRWRQRRDTTEKRQEWRRELAELQRSFSARERPRRTRHRSRAALS
jgi:hypothetical protein